MGIRERIQREIEAIRRDREFSSQGSHDIREVMAHFEEYPSIITRWNHLQGSFFRGVSNVRDTPTNIKWFFHRGRHGWSPRENWSMDYALSKQLDEQFEEFIQYFDPESEKYCCGGPVPANELLNEDFDEEANSAAFLADLKTIRQGFRNYRLNVDNNHKIKNMQERIIADQLAHEGIEESFRLMAKHWEGLWW